MSGAFNKIMTEMRKDEKIDVNAPKVGHALTSYEYLDNQASKFLVDVRFMSKQKQGERCPLCKKTMNNQFHENDC